MAWLAERSFLWKAAAVVVAMMWLGVTVLGIPAIETDVAYRIASYVVMAISAVMMCGIFFLLAKASPWVLRLCCGLAIFTWSMNSALIFLFSNPGPEFERMTPLLAVCGLCAAALAACVVIDLLRKPTAP